MKRTLTLVLMALVAVSLFAGGSSESASQDGNVIGAQNHVCPFQGA